MQSALACGFATLVAIAAGCGSKPLQSPDATGAGGSFTTGIGGSIATGSGGSFWTEGGTIDGPWDAGFSGRRSFVVTSIVSQDGGASLTHRFTMVFDADQRSAIVGANGYGTTVGIQQVADGTFRLTSTVGFNVTVPGTCSASVLYDSVGFNLDATGRLMGAGHGQLTTFQTDVGNSVLVTTSLTGVADTVTPTLALVTDGSDIADPFPSFSVSSPEPLPVDSHAVLRAAGGDVIGLTPYPKNEGYVLGFAMPAAILLRYGETYTVDIDGLADFAGNRAAATNALTFNTKPPPPLVAADGFESVTDATLGGAEVLSGAAAPTISGSRSLYIPPVTAFGTPPTTQLALRIAIAPGNSVLRFSFRNVTVSPTATYGADFKVASVGGSIVSTVLPDAGGTGTSTVIDQTSVTLSPVITATINLPADAAGEVVLARTTKWGGSCGLPYPPAAGIIIDDLRAE
jgi:hypothetical protein